MNLRQGFPPLNINKQQSNIENSIASNTYGIRAGHFQLFPSGFQKQSASTTDQRVYIIVQ